MKIGLKSTVVAVLAMTGSAQLFADDVVPDRGRPADCPALHAKFSEAFLAGRYAMPSENSALSAMLALKEAGCDMKVGSNVPDELLAGLRATLQRLAETNRRSEFCSVAILLRDHPTKGNGIGEKYWQLNCEGRSLAPPSATWSQADMEYVRGRVTKRFVAESSLDSARSAMDRALGAGAIYSPAGDNVVEHALRGRALVRTNDDGTGALFDEALRGLVPSLITAVEEAYERRDRAEFDRLRGLLSQISPDLLAVQRFEAMAGEW